MSESPHVLIVGVDLELAEIMTIRLRQAGVHATVELDVAAWKESRKRPNVVIFNLDPNYFDYLFQIRESQLSQGALLVGCSVRSAPQGIAGSLGLACYLPLPWTSQQWTTLVKKTVCGGSSTLISRMSRCDRGHANHGIRRINETSTEFSSKRVLR